MFKTEDKKTLMDVFVLLAESGISVVCGCSHARRKYVCKGFMFIKKHILITFKMCVKSFFLFVFKIQG